MMITRLERRLGVLEEPNYHGGSHLLPTARGWFAAYSNGWLIIKKSVHELRVEIRERRVRLLLRGFFASVY